MSLLAPVGDPHLSSPGWAGTGSRASSPRASRCPLVLMCPRRAWSSASVKSEEKRSSAPPRPKSELYLVGVRVRVGVRTRMRVRVRVEW